MAFWWYSGSIQRLRSIVLIMQKIAIFGDGKLGSFLVQLTSSKIRQLVELRKFAGNVVV